MTPPAGMLPLLPCPFCGGAAEIRSRKTTFIECKSCGAMFCKGRGTTEQQVKRAALSWNRRALPLPAGEASPLTDAQKDELIQTYLTYSALSAGFMEAPVLEHMGYDERDRAGLRHGIDKLLERYNDLRAAHAAERGKPDA